MDENQQFTSSPEAQPMVVNSDSNLAGTAPPPGMEESLAGASPPAGMMEDLAGSPPPPGMQEEVKQDALQSEYGTPKQQLIAGLEGAAQGVAGPLATLAETKMLGVPEKDILKRQEANPFTHFGTQALGLAGSIASGAGFGAKAAQAGEAALGALGITSKVGSLATKAAVENMMISGGDEVSKMILKDPNQSVQSGITDIGLSGLLGGGLGGAMGLWSQTFGKQTSGILNAIADKAGGIEGAPINSVDNMVAQSGIEVNPVVRAALSGDTAAIKDFGLLRESSTKSGQKVVEALNDFKKQASDGIAHALGKNPEDITNLAHLSEAESGNEIKKSLVDTIKEQLAPIGEQFERIKSKYTNEALPDAYKGSIATRATELADKEGYSLSPKFPQGKVIRDLIEDLPNLKTMEDLRKYTSVLGDTTFSNPELRRVGGQLKSILRDAEDELITATAGAKAPETLAEHAAARESYKSAMSLIDNLNDRLHVGKFHGPDSFLSALREMSPEDIIRRLSPKSDSELIPLLNQNFPKVGDKVRDYYLSQALRGSASKAAPGEVLNPKTFFSAVDKMAPETREFLITPEASSKLEAIQGLLERLPARENPSGTAKTLDSLLSHFPASATGIGALVLGHGVPGAVAGYALGHLTKLLARDVPDAVKLATLKFLGSSKPVDSVAFKKMTDMIAATVRGEHLINKSVTNLFRPVADVVTASMKPTESDRKKLDRQLTSFQNDPQKLASLTDRAGHYMDDHNQAVGQTAGQAVQFLNSMRPGVQPAGALDRPMPPTKAQEQQYNRCLDIAQQPLMVLDHIKKGTLQTQDVVTLKKCYPALYERLAQKVTDEVAQAKSKGTPIPYKTRQGISLFLMQPVDYTMTPQGIMGAQPQVQQPQQPQGAGPSQGSRGSTKALQKMPTSFMTPNQAKESHRQIK